MNIYINRYADFVQATGYPPQHSPQGFAMQLQGDYLVFVNEQEEAPEQVRTLAHEFAHIALGHMELKLTMEEQAERVSCFILGFAQLFAATKGMVATGE